MNQIEQSPINPFWSVSADPTPLFESMSEQMRLGSLPDLFQAITSMQHEAIRIAIHAPFLPFHLYANAVDRKTPLVSTLTSMESAAEHVASTMNHNADVLIEESAEETKARPISQKSASPKAKTAPGPNAGSGT